MTSQLCGSILAALGHRKKLLDAQTSLNDQISILERITSPKADEDINIAEESKKSTKQRPVAFVPPRMLSCSDGDGDQQQLPEDNTSATISFGNIALETVPRRSRGRPKKNSSLQKTDSSDDEKKGLLFFMYFTSLCSDFHERFCPEPTIQFQYSWSFDPKMMFCRLIP